MTYSPEQAALLAAVATMVGTIVTALLAYRFNIYKAKNEHALKEDEASDKNRDSTIQSFRNELGLNPGLLKEIFSLQGQLVTLSGKLVSLEIQIQTLAAGQEALTKKNASLEKEHQALKEAHTKLTQKYGLSLQRIASLETDLEETKRQLGVERNLREALEQERSPKPTETTTITTTTTPL